VLERPVELGDAGLAFQQSALPKFGFTPDLAGKHVDAKAVRHAAELWFKGDRLLASACQRVPSTDAAWACYEGALSHSAIAVCAFIWFEVILCGPIIIVSHYASCLQDADEIGQNHSAAHNRSALDSYDFEFHHAATQQRGWRMDNLLAGHSSPADYSMARYGDFSITHQWFELHLRCIRSDYAETPSLIASAWCSVVCRISFHSSCIESPACTGLSERGAHSLPPCRSIAGWATQSSIVGHGQHWLRQRQFGRGLALSVQSGSLGKRHSR
jgi:hypothetical protein